MAIGPIAKAVAQAAMMGLAVLARALPAAYGAALQNAKKGGVDAAAKASKGGAGGVFSKNKISVDEALMVLNIGKSEVKPELIQKQFDKYFAANAVEKGGSFYLQSKIYRAKEQLDEFIEEQKREKEGGQG
mmetsp:Transcript_4954/g.5714  ORF Transcript_4954/g.5714 Transcript_4954/m.5714 type:complete len:131 (-) Transcript_4954:338-730(-)|eukprot:CAMPEP_0204612132 /NCGR_PEP_ID=MMETSP0717-20131115/233_1 /ASSEMBLY_ACC=CAM_ASM_000666 /TAXON_ID=230516 /ORGANISM="Chaetoceros curvisetus" /LENGTH=130 /DNA_ID=CAMNT_0051624081 /DNA_START=71 /DNA_END=463 /DNA_ORIENTATION=+